MWKEGVRQRGEVRGADDDAISLRPARRREPQAKEGVANCLEPRFDLAPRSAEGGSTHEEP